MDWQAVSLSVRLALTTVVILIPFAFFTGRWLAFSRFPGKGWVEGLFALPLVLPPTVIGYYLMVSMGVQSPLGEWIEKLTGAPLVFSFQGLVFASVLFNIPFAIQPIQRAFEAIPSEVREAARCCGMGYWTSLLRIELPLVWPGILSAWAMTFAHTMGEFGVVLMVGGNIPGKTQTVAISIYDSVQSFDYSSAGTMSLFLLCLSLATIAVSYTYLNRLTRWRTLK